MSEYAEGHVKRNPETGAVALRTHFADNADFANMTWLVSSTIHGPSNVGTAAVDAWDDLFVPPAVDG